MFNKKEGFKSITSRGGCTSACGFPSNILTPSTCGTLRPVVFDELKTPVEYLFSSTINGGCNPGADAPDFYPLVNDSTQPEPPINPDATITYIENDYEPKLFYGTGITNLLPHDEAVIDTLNLDRNQLRSLQLNANADREIDSRNELTKFFVSGMRARFDEGSEYSTYF